MTRQHHWRMASVRRETGLWGPKRDGFQSSEIFGHPILGRKQLSRIKGAHVERIHLQSRSQGHLSCQALQQCLHVLSWSVFSRIHKGTKPTRPVSSLIVSLSASFAVNPLGDKGTPHCSALHASCPQAQMDPPGCGQDVVQEVLDLPEWRPGNALALLFGGVTFKPEVTPPCGGIKKFPISAFQHSCLAPDLPVSAPTAPPKVGHFPVMGH